MSNYIKNKTKLIIKIKLMSKSKLTLEDFGLSNISNQPQSILISDLSIVEKD